MAGFSGVDTVMLMTTINGKDFWTEYKRNKCGSWDEIHKTSSLSEYCQVNGLFMKCSKCKDFRKSCRKQFKRVSGKELAKIIEGHSAEMRSRNNQLVVTM